MFQPEKDFEEYGMFVFKYLMSLCGNADLAEELTQETFYRAIRSSGKFDGNCKVSTWLCQIAKHIWYQELDRRRRKKTEPLQENGTGDGLENDYCRKEQTMEVMKAVHILEESNREITAHVAECAPCKEILEQMQEEVQEKAPKEKRKINPFRKFNRRMRRAVAMAVVICIGVGGFGYKAFARGFAINPQDITMEPKLEGDMLYLNFEVKDGVLVHSASMYDQTMASIDLRKAWASPGDAEQNEPNRFRWGMNLRALTVGSGERMEMQLIDGGLAVVEVPNENSVTIDNESGTTNAAVMFEEGDSVTAVVLGDESEFDTDEYTVNVNYGNETVSYKLKDLIEMAEK